ncbi:B- and T-lymphocyte attenuator [Centropristis striata]|uniref:B- and T-lymphocyte attenuator n=1 Tax=Centropristis striata TaxID=184440 RepID=UPI0027DF640E|nr:B- and T-lymphocyte attenuator [Centropristis striata]
MNASGRMDRLTFIYLLIFCCFTFVCIHGEGQDFSSCEVALMVRRGTTLRTVPQSSLTVCCPVKHCGESLSVSWCKLLDTGKCKWINYTENREIILTEKQVKDELISYLTFTRISIHDDGLYRCSLKGYGPDAQISHKINISVSESNKGVKPSECVTEVELPNAAAGDYSMPWLPYLAICLTVALLVATLTVITLLSFYVWERILTKNTKEQDTSSTHIIPDLPNGNAPSPFFLRPHLSFLNDTNSPSTSERPPPHPALVTSGTQPAVTNTADGSQESDRAVYAVVNHRQSGVLAREQPASEQQQKNTEYAAIIVS